MFGGVKYNVKEESTMIYDVLKNNIKYQNNAYDKGVLTAESYNQWKESTLCKMDLFLLRNRITQAQYGELSEMLLEV